MKYLKLLLFTVLTVLVSCSSEDSNSVTFNFTYTFSPNSANDSESTSSVLVYDQDGNDIGGSELAFLTGIKSGETKSVDVTVDKGGILQFSGFTKDGFKRVFTDKEVKNGDAVSWNSANNKAFVTGDGSGDGNTDDSCKNWVEYNTECLSSVPDGTGSSKPGLRSRVCRISETSTEITVRTEIEAINGGIDNIDFYKGLKIFYGDGSTATISKEQFNQQGVIIKEYTAFKISINNEGKDWDDLPSSPYLVVWCENN
ncbi:putative lipoprotein [Tenacibaculum sp. 190524A05c]|uniref:hypothetical protein n=1 Tax=Tenacibaculum platacis TaxID=3137852 RepID=UPI0031FB8ED3